MRVWFSTMDGRRTAELEIDDGVDEDLICSELGLEEDSEEGKDWEIISVEDFALCKPITIEDVIVYQDLITEFGEELVNLILQEVTGLPLTSNDLHTANDYLRDCYYGTYSSETEFAEEYCLEMGDISMDSMLFYYIDFSSWFDDSDFCSYYLDHEFHIFIESL